MNITIPGYSETSPTLFNIQVSVERTTFQVRKRYSDFVEFASKVEQEMGEKSPVELPGKKWIGNKQRDFLDQRRRGLEIYLRSMAKNDEWRESLAFQEFLEIIKHIKHKSNKDKAKLSDATDWLKGITEARDYIQNAMRSPSGAEGRRYIVLAGSKINELEASLAGDSSSLGDGEYRRRRDTLQEMMRSLLSIKSQHGTGIAGSGSGPGAFPGGGAGRLDSHSQAENKLFSGQDEKSPIKSSRRVLGKGGETDRTRDKDNEGLLQLQKDDMSEQDQMINYLRQIIGRQRQLGEDINTELLQQNELLDELDDDTHATNARLNQAKRRVGKMI